MEAAINSSFKKATDLVLSEIGFTAYSLLDDGSRSAERIDLIAMLGLVGDLKGHFVVRIGAESAIGFVSSLSGHLGMHDENPADGQYRKAAIGEIVNQIGGRAVALLSDKGIECMITPPTLIAGVGVDAMLPESDDRTAFRLQADFGEILCSVVLKTSKTI